MSIDDQHHQAKNSNDSPILGIIRSLPAEEILGELMTRMYAVSIMLWDRDGVILCANDVVARGFQCEAPEDVIGKSIKEFSPPEWAAERIKVARLSLESGLRITFLEILGGYRLRTLFRPMKLDGSESILVTIEQLTASDYEYACCKETNEMVIHANVIDLGRLDVLSARELEVLALMGQGYRAKDIADKLHRSVSTIDNHRDKIGEKLGINDRGDLINMAKLAALQVEDAGRTRVQFSRHIGAPPQKSLLADEDDE